MMLQKLPKISQLTFYMAAFSNRLARNLLVAVLFLVISLSVGASLYAQAGTVRTEFDYKPKKYVPMLFGSANFRGRDYMTATEAYKTLGLGGALLYNMNLDKYWRGHKFLYWYMDVEFQQEWNTARVDEEFRPILSLNPGILVRSYLPFIKIFYGTGLNFRIGNSDFEPWGIYGQLGLEVYRFFLAAKVIFIPGEAITHNELRLGYIFTPSKKIWKRY